MNDYEQKVREFHLATDAHVDVPLDAKLLELRKTLIMEEVKELFAEIDLAIAALNEGKPVPKPVFLNMMKELADVQYVLSGSAVTFGLPLEKVFERVHESNMSKLGPDGKAIHREDGKVLKGPNYHPPVLDDLLDEAA
jgi:predicted HAD superfamily Cof-like phosphohydrolase